MSSFKNFSSMLNDLQKQADGRGTLDGSAIEDFLSIAGYEEPAGGGGGGGDFEIVTITLINNSADKYLGVNRLVWVYNDALETESFNVEAGETVEVQVVLYKGQAVMYPDPVDDTIDPIITGDITFNSDEWYFEITGAGSIALTGAGQDDQ